MTANTKLIQAIADARFGEYGEEATEWLEHGDRAAVRVRRPQVHPQATFDPRRRTPEEHASLALAARVAVPDLRNPQHEDVDIGVVEGPHRDRQRVVVLVVEGGRLASTVRAFVTPH